MVIKEEKALTVSEVASLIGNTEKTEAMKDFIKQFNIIPVKKTMELKEE